MKHEFCTECLEPLIAEIDDGAPVCELCAEHADLSQELRDSEFEDGIEAMSESYEDED